MLSIGGFLVLVLASFVALIPTVQGLDQARREYTMMAERGGLTALFYASNRGHVYGMPTLVVGATASLILSGELTGQNLLLDGLAICFASNIDDLVSFFAVGEEVRERIEQAIEQTIGEHEGRIGWKRNRGYGVILAITLII